MNDKDYLRKLMEIYKNEKYEKYYHSSWEEDVRKYYLEPTPKTDLDMALDNHTIRSVITKILERCETEDILELLDINEVQQYLRKKKLENIKE